MATATLLRSAASPSGPGSESRPDDQANDVAEPLSVAAVVGLLPAWLISGIAHIILILVLALCTYAVVRPDRMETLTAELPPRMEVELEEVTVGAALVVENLAVPSNDAAGMAALGEIPQAELAETGTEAAANVPPEQLELGQLFGREGTGLSTVGLGTGTGGGAEFFGVKAKGKSFVFIVDASNSMRRGKFDAAKRELLAAVKRLKPEQSFYVVFFNNAAHRMFDEVDPEPRPIRASPTNIGKLERWMSTVELHLRTDPLDSVKFALSRMPDAIYILSDGKFTDGGRTVEWLKEHNWIEKDPIVGTGPKVTVHTIGFYSRDGEETLKAIAEKYKGTYRFVPPGG